ncbi:hypothetical protein IU501_06775 [Nocardia otitidiscaviarum]|uniref:Uncharacterized protein n=1 Tax=Nocardia otitidiscaviarum TaxID=1823 RepID=A0A378YQC4_9NOCA|nr:hypothetical protein [Nocardia otitidiscaviarum]MBF6132703.1 hypothetical protein [Nocardia otitidiscaviarum]MBF6239043.1 hypothetical protein [Nocardia otitidiscaviarum]MBF6486122.1 hypothetical protein [Nocardia otitidiscaviarum]SUA79342.1 Uncharacterised protein [Nocardia otitidiscaviarum]
MQRSAFLLITTVGIILAGTGASELLGDESSPAPAVRNLSQHQPVVLEADGGVVRPAACVKLASGRYSIQTQSTR